MEGRRPTRLTTSTAAQMATPSVHACSARCAGTAAPRIVDTWASSNACQVEGATAAATNRQNKRRTGLLRPCKQLAFCQVIMLKTVQGCGSHTAAATMSRMSVGSRRLSSSSLKNGRGLTSLNLLAPKAARRASRPRSPLASGGSPARRSVCSAAARPSAPPCFSTSSARLCCAGRLLQASAAHCCWENLCLPRLQVLGHCLGRPFILPLLQVHRRLDAAGPEQVHILPHGSTAEGIQ